MQHKFAFAESVFHYSGHKLLFSIFLNFDTFPLTHHNLIRLIIPYFSGFPLSLPCSGVLCRGTRNEK